MQSKYTKKQKLYKYYYIFCAALGVLGLLSNYQGGNDFHIIISTSFFLAGLFGYYEFRKKDR